MSLPDPSILENFVFLRPWWLAGIPLALALYTLQRLRHSAMAQWRRIVAPHLLAHLIVNRNERTWLSPIGVTTLSLVLACLALAGPSWEIEPPPFAEDKAPLVIAIDLWPTMDAVDISPTRLERAKQKIRDLIALRQGARTAIVAYAGDAHVVLPFTDDAGILGNYVEALGTSIMPDVPDSGRHPEAALKLAAAMLDKENVAGTILLISDSFPAAALPFFSAHAAQHGNDLIVLAVGTEQGGAVRTPSGRIAHDAKGVPLLSQLDSAGLQALSDATGADIVRVSLDHRDVESIQRAVQIHMEAARDSNLQSRRHDAGYTLLFPLLILLAYGFRRGWVVRW